MKRIIILLLLFISIVICCGVVSNGFSIDALDLKVYSYEQIEDQSETLTLAVAAYNKKNDTEFEAILDSLDEAVDEYEKAKEEYEDVIEELGITEESTDDDIIVASSFPVYEIDFLWATIGNYAKKEGLVITMDVEKSASLSEDLGYGLYNLNFIVTGEYINIADFLYDIEDDDQLGFEIRDYAMTAIVAEADDEDEGIEKGDITGTKATFTIYNVPLNSDSLLETVVQTTDDTDENTEEDDDSTNTVGSDTVSSSSTNSTNNTTD